MNSSAGLSPIGSPGGGDVALEVSGVRKHYGSVTALAGVNFTVRRGEFLTLLGPSGSGKTTLLKVIAGFEDLDEGSIILEGKHLAQIPPSRRDIGMVFQNYALFPHLTVAENVAFPLKMRSYSRAQIDERVASFLEMVDLGDYGARYPHQLSGGQQQRVALARATVFGPRILLLDEPFGALDRRLREAMQLQVRAFQQRLHLTTIFITHDQEEALVMSDRIAVMQQGQLQQIAEPGEVYRRPASEFVATFLGESNILSGRAARDKAGRPVVVTDGGDEIRVEGLEEDDGGRLSVLVRPEGLHPLKEDENHENTVPGRVVEVVYLGATIKYVFETESGTRLLFRRQAGADEEVLPAGRSLRLGWSSREAHLLR